MIRETEKVPKSSRKKEDEWIPDKGPVAGMNTYDSKIPTGMTLNVPKNSKEGPLHHLQAQ